MEVEEGAKIALIDTTFFHLQRNEILAGMNGIRTKISSINAQNEILRQQMENLNVNIERIENMMKDDAATKKQYDDLTDR
jgi:HlyD family secretion protein